ncbi:PP2C family serine/threonine-protein phosphatase [Umezawaea endophytica]|uniref:PP2C family serine/threonine-protein phosphatase n=1 Tax=Umezawaea endophytica TaxID=1654476 RepID=UPI003557F0E1
MLDGASSFGPAIVQADEYVDPLSRQLARLLQSDDRSLVDVLREAIRSVASSLQLKAGQAPSSTVLLTRVLGERFEVLVLGDSTAIVHTRTGGEIRTTDPRLSDIATDLREQYRQRLKTGAGYDGDHRAILRQLQAQELGERNTPGGYWIAEADERAASNAIVQSFALSDVDWCVLATDGAQRTIDHLGIQWGDVAGMDEPALADLLAMLHRWEAEEDPNGADLPRPKRHDDKVVVTWSPPE